MTQSDRILLLDDETANLESLERILRSDGARVYSFLDPIEAAEQIRTRGCDVVLTDLRMGMHNGLEFLETVKKIDSTIEVILITAFGTVELAVEAMRKGAYDFITKPLQRVQVLKAINKALDRRRLVSENHSLREALVAAGDSFRQNEILGKSPSMQKVMEMATQAGQTRANVLIEGESGTGKGLIAEYIHRVSQRMAIGNATGLFVKLNCASIPENLLEAELFGYESGAFTGAQKRKRGRVELAEKGSLFLDEIATASLAVQAKLLRFVQDGEFERLGGTETLKVSTRVLSATNANLKEEIGQSKFRGDLFYRLNVIQIHMPALRERREDIPLLATRFLNQSAEKNHLSAPLLHSSTMEKLCSYRWPGNIRELQNLMERLVVLVRRDTVYPEDLPSELGGGERDRTVRIPLGTPLRDVEKFMMEAALRDKGGDKKEAAKLLGVHPRTIYRFLESTVASEPQNSGLVSESCRLERPRG